MKRTQVHLTSVEEIFRFELLFAKICGGFHFEWSHLPPAYRKWLALTYRLAIVGSTRLWTPRHFMTSPGIFSGSLSQVPMQNFKLFYLACQTIGYLMVFVNILTGFKSRELTLVLLKKRFSTRYLTRVRPSDNDGSAADKSGRFHQATDWSLTGGHKERSGLIGLITGKRPSLAGGFLRSSMTRYLLILNLVVAIYSVHVHSGFHEVITQTRGNGSAHSAGPQGLSAALGQSPGPMQELFGSLVSSLVHLLVALIEASLNLSQMYGQIFAATLITSSMADMLRYSVAFDGSVSSDGGADKQPTRLAAVSSQVRQTTTSTLSSSSSSGIGSGGNSLTKLAAAPIQQNEHLLTTRLLLQAREVLFVIRYMVNIEYLLVLLFDLARFGAIFCLLNESVFNSQENQKTFPLIAANFALVLMSISLTRLGHHWLHNEVEKLIDDLEKSNVLSGWSEKRQIEYSVRGSTTATTKDARRTLDQQSSAHIQHNGSLADAIPPSDVGQSNRTTALRLAREVFNIWPTDWYTPDYRSCIEQVIYVLTFVATFHQLAEASFRVDQNSPLTKS